MKLQEIYKKYNFTPPAGEFIHPANVEYILSEIIDRGFCGEICLTRKEFTSFFIAMKDEVLVSMLLNKKEKGMNSHFEDGVEFRGIIIRIS